MCGLKQRQGAQVVCAGHGFVRNLNLGQGFYRRGIVMGDLRFPRPPRLVRAWAALTLVLQAG